MTDEPILMLRGDTIGLGPLRADLVETYQRWMNDLRVTRTLEIACKPLTREAEEGWLASALQSGDAVFTIYELDTLRPIGNCGLHEINTTENVAEFGIAIGEPDAWGKGYGTEATRLLLAYAFDVLGLDNLMLEVYGVNTRAIRAYERAGFRRVGVRRNAKKIGRERCDVILMDAVPGDFPPSELHAIMHPDAARPADG